MIFEILGFKTKRFSLDPDEPPQPTVISGFVIEIIVIFPDIFILGANPLFGPTRHRSQLCTVPIL